MSVKYNLLVVYIMDFFSAVKKMMQFFLMKVMERFYPNYVPTKPILQRQTNVPVEQTTKPDGYKNIHTSQYQDEAERMAYVRRARITGL